MRWCFTPDLLAERQDLWDCVPSSVCRNLKTGLCPSADHGLAREGLCRRHVRSFPPKPLHFLERKTKFCLPDARTTYTAACCFFHLPIGKTCPTVPAPRLSLSWCFMWTAQTAPVAGSRTEGWHCWTFPKTEELDYPSFPAFPCWWVLALLKGTMCDMGSTSTNLKALGRQGDEGISMPRQLNLRGCV